MSISKTILYQPEAELVQALQYKPNLNEIDEYGYTPLIQAAICDSLNKLKMLVAAGADVNFTDLTGRSALHWAADNNDLDMVRYLLEHQADANIYTRAGQPPLVMPLLREHEQIKQALYGAKAHLAFAQDFINAKSLGHRFDLIGRADVINAKGEFIEVEFEGFYLQFSLAMLASSLRDFQRNFGGKHLRQHFHKLKVIIQSLENASDLLRYQHYLIDKHKMSDKIDPLLAQSPLIIPISYEGHAITFIKVGHWLIRCDRGEFGRNNQTVIIYKMGKPELLTQSFLKTLIYKRQFKDFIEQGIIEYLDLAIIGHLPLPPQISGNCSWSNVEAVVPAMMFTLSLDELSGGRAIEEAREIALYFYDEWEYWDKSRSLHFCVESYQSADPARQAAKAAIMAAILYQALDYNRPEDQPLAEKILAVLSDRKHRYILEAYASVFSVNATDQLYRNFANILDQSGIDISKLQ